MSESVGVKLCATEAEADAYGDMYWTAHSPLPAGGWLAIPKHPSDQLRLDKVLARWGIHGAPTATARPSDPATSHEAAQRASTHELSDRLLCLKAHVYAGDRGLNGDELELRTGRPYESLGPRRPDLEKAGLLTKATTTGGKPLKRNRKQVYVATPAGREAWQTEEQQRGAA
ncbi:MAG: hypothetical protein KDB37_12875 [Ilumatobacter sp.]|nr:hypothetical protein [Ilumatobacter sp.]